MGAIEAQITSGDLQRSDQICAVIDVYKKEGKRGPELGAAFYKVGRQYFKKGKYGWGVWGISTPRIFTEKY